MKSKEFASYREEIRAIMPINTDEKSKQYRAIWEKYHKVNILTGEEIK